MRATKVINIIEKQRKLVEPGVRNVAEGVLVSVRDWGAEDKTPSSLNANSASWNPAQAVGFQAPRLFRRHPREPASLPWTQGLAAAAVPDAVPPHAQPTPGGPHPPPLLRTWPSRTQQNGLRPEAVRSEPRATRLRWRSEALNAAEPDGSQGHTQKLGSSAAVTQATATNSCNITAGRPCQPLPHNSWATSAAAATPGVGSVRAREREGPPKTAHSRTFPCDSEGLQGPLSDRLRIRNPCSSSEVTKSIVVAEPLLGQDISRRRNTASPCKPER